MGNSENEWIELRRHPRQPTLNTGRIVYKKATFISQCRITDVSDGGAGLELPDLIDLPDVFDLEIRGAPTRRCAVRWRRGARLGVQYLD